MGWGQIDGGPTAVSWLCAALLSEHGASETLDKHGAEVCAFIGFTKTGVWSLYTKKTLAADIIVDSETECFSEVQ